jgi:uncharacterized protein
MSLGVVLLILANLGPTPWDVLHVGLYNQFGLTIGSWSIIVGILILTLSAIISKKFPQVGAFLNMVLIGLFIDMYMLIPFLQTPPTLIGKLIMFFFGILINGYGMGIYISARLGAGPRDSLMLALTSRTGWQLRNVRALIEIIALLAGWILGGPVFWGTIFIGMTMGWIAGFTLPQCQSLTDTILNARKRKKRLRNFEVNELKRGVGE